jgi:hypothetical protein
VAGLYLHPPVYALVLAVDEEPRNQVPERALGWLRLPSDVVGTSFAKGMWRKRSSTLQAALEVATGLITDDHNERRTHGVGASRATITRMSWCRRWRNWRAGSRLWNNLRSVVAACLDDRATGEETGVA